MEKLFVKQNTKKRAFQINYDIFVDTVKHQNTWLDNFLLFSMCPDCRQRIYTICDVVNFFINLPQFKASSHLFKARIHERV